MAGVPYYEDIERGFDHGRKGPSPGASAGRSGDAPLKHELYVQPSMAAVSYGEIQRLRARLTDAENALSLTEQNGQVKLFHKENEISTLKAQLDLAHSQIELLQGQKAQYFPPPEAVSGPPHVQAIGTYQPPSVPVPITTAPTVSPIVHTEVVPYAMASSPPAYVSTSYDPNELIMPMSPEQLEQQRQGASMSVFNRLSTRQSRKTTGAKAIGDTTHHARKTADMARIEQLARPKSLPVLPIPTARKPSPPRPPSCASSMPSPVRQDCLVHVEAL